MTGNCYADYGIVVLVGLLGWVARHYKLAWATTLAEMLSKAKQPEKQIENKPVDQAAALRAGAEQVAGPGILTILLPFITTLLPLILDLIAQFRARNSREPNPLEVRQIIQDAQRAAQRGRIYPILIDELPEQDLEQATAGASKVTGLVDRTNRTLDSIDQAAREGRDLFRRGNELLGR